MAFCDLLHTYHKQVTNVSPACFCHHTVGNVDVSPKCKVISAKNVEGQSDANDRDSGCTRVFMFTKDRQNSLPLSTNFLQDPTAPFKGISHPVCNLCRYFIKPTGLSAYILFSNPKGFALQWNIGFRVSGTLAVHSKLL